jgi:hypothetical protein
MKSFIRIIFATAILTGCSNPLNDSTVFQSEKLKGKYKVDLTPFIAESVKSDKEDDSWSKLEKSMVGLAISSMDIELSFYDNNKGIMHMDRGIINLANVFSNKPTEKTQEFSYKVENDSVLYMKDETSKEFIKWAIVRKFSENYDYLQFMIIEEGKEKVFFNLNKIVE